MKRLLQKSLIRMFELVLIAILSIFSLYFYLSIAEKFLLVDLPFVEVVSAYNFSNFQSNLDGITLPTKENDKFGFYGIPGQLRIPRLGASIQLQELKVKNNRYLVTKDLGNFLVFSKGTGGRLGSTIVIEPDQSQLLDVFQLVVEGDRLIIETVTDWKQIYTVKRKMVISTNQQYFPSTDDSSLIVMKKIAENSILVIEAEYQLVEGSE